MYAKVSIDMDPTGELAHYSSPIIAVAVYSQEVGAYACYSGPVGPSPKSTSRI